MSYKLLLCVWILGAALAHGGELLNAEESAAARKLYLNKCSKCHKMYEPSKYDDREWNSWITKMGKKAKLKRQEVETLTNYIDQNLRNAKKGRVATNGR